ncbi:DUF2165 family protein [Sulfitobacter aestuariivivens]|uniref:DUF2165 family protein n=1 Tax=Sulfitobacter aestuariivivens TaxID=2766981 RepID=A0A927D857_9RHOB|nr:DUF2165 family protein [Sulfitobacter aestuariivivens]MBD3665342.1 DUF2165 family protein [Sulfitobacter aestuariivivens]
MALMILIAQTACLTFLALWLTTGVRDNVLYPLNNEAFTAEVMTMARMQVDYPESYALVAHRKVESRKLQLLAFRLVVIWELLACIALWAGVGVMVLAILNMIDTQIALAIGLAGTLMFTTTWAMFLIVGNHFSYWFSHEGAQNTHYQMTLWGIATMIFLAVA